MLNLWLGDYHIEDSRTGQRVSYPHELYDGHQLQPLRNYLKFGLIGSSVVAWRGPCKVTPELMKDGEDLRAGARIESSDMLHFIFEIFDQRLFAGVSFQRLFAASVLEELLEASQAARELRLLRDGDDLWTGDRKRKLSISIAIPSLNSVLIHFAMNISNEGTPIPTLSLEDLGVDPAAFAKRAMTRISSEYGSILEATWKVRG